MARARRLRRPRVRAGGIATWLLAPYLLWIVYATALNVAIWSLN